MALGFFEVRWHLTTNCLIHPKVSERAYQKLWLRGCNLSERISGDRYKTNNLWPVLCIGNLLILFASTFSVYLNIEAPTITCGQTTFVRIEGWTSERIASSRDASLADALYPNAHPLGKFEGKLVPNISPKRGLDSVFHAVHSGFQSLSVELLDSGFQSLMEIPDSSSCILDSGFHKQKGSGFQNGDSVTWSE